jgi:hypothetical protein
MLALSFKERWSKLFSGKQALPENRGACVGTRFGPMDYQGPNQDFPTKWVISLLS